ncbi:hypothetical protein FHR87_003585 [Azomonas macrocytogenes]|uniref:Uncharacterized protein n=1 Tax=Azomonas macrocytogenes TaxID=69962 RepID=A0A839T8F1_AZOMA|nr:hypothetical protein [Azomonas macrocytogenes]
MASTFEKLHREKPETVASARAKADERLINLHLAELRERMEKTQIDLLPAVNDRDSCFSEACLTPLERLDLRPLHRLTPPARRLLYYGPR